MKRISQLALLIVCFVCFVQANANGQTETKEDTSNEKLIQELKEQLKGTWQKEQTEGCLCGRCLKVDFDRVDDDFCVESNQIYVGAYYELDATRKLVHIYFEKPAESGMGVTTLPWERFDKERPIAVMDISALSKGKVSVRWIGFTEAKDPRKKYTFGKEYQGGYRKTEGVSQQAKPSTNLSAQGNSSNQTDMPVASSNLIVK